MKKIRHVGVIDIGKTNIKVAVVDVEERREIGVLKRANTVLPAPPYPHYDIDGHWEFICEGLSELHRQHGLDALSVTTHGACVVLLDEEGGLAAPVLDYEFEGPDQTAEAYEQIRPAFSQTGSPRLGMGLNVGAQLFWQLKNDPGLKARVATVLTYPQYWSYRLTGVRANELTSLGCHTDLWCPTAKRFSSLVDRLSLKEKMAPVKHAADCLGTLLPDIAAQTGLPETLPVACGIHDSNASLFPHLLQRSGAFSVVSTGTWVIAFAISEEGISQETLGLDPARDTLVNVNAFGDPVPSARFMGGREFETILQGQSHDYTQADIDQVLKRSIMLLPAVEPRSGPFQGRKAQWTVPEASLKSGERFVALSYYLALMTAECLTMIGAAGPIVVEGPFARNPLYLNMLQAVSGRAVEAAEGSLTGTSIGAALLLTDPEDTSAQNQSQQQKGGQDRDDHLSGYAADWQRAVNTLTPA